MIKYIVILEHNNVYKYYFEGQSNNLNTMSFYRRNMKQTVRSGSTIYDLYNKSYRGCQPLNHYIEFNLNTYFNRFRFANSTRRSNFQKLRNIR